jgi:rubrerythrin
MGDNPDGNTGQRGKGPTLAEVTRSAASEGVSANASSRRAALGAAATFGALAAVPIVGRLLRLGDAAAAPSKAQDIQILQLVMQLEFAQVAFYEQALRQAGLTGDLREFAQTSLKHEREHLSAIRGALGAKTVPKPTMEFGNKTKSPKAFINAATELEDLAVAGYNGQATNLTKQTLAAAAEIVSVEARHAAWVRAIAGEVAAPDPVDKPITAQEFAQGLQQFGVRS